MNFQEFEKSLQTANSLHQLNLALEHFLASYKINTFAFTYYSYSPSSLNKIKYDYSSENLKLWHEHYISEGYEDTDSTLSTVYKTILPTKWDLQEQLREAKTAREKRMREDSIAYGIKRGISIPIHGPQEDFAILVISERHDQTCLEHFDKFQHEIFSAAYYFYNALQKELLKQQTSKDEKPLLNSREMQCLHLIAKQYSTEEIAKECGITVRTVNFHIQRLNKKLGTSNKYQSLLVGLRKGIISG